MNRGELIEFLLFVEKGLINPKQIKDLPTFSFIASSAEISEIIADQNPFTSYLAKEYKDEKGSVIQAQQMFELIQVRKAYPFGIVIISEKKEKKLIAETIYLRMIDKYVQGKNLLINARNVELEGCKNFC